MDAESLKALIGSPVGLFFIMVAGALGSAFKQMAVARRESGLKVSATAYLLDYWPETLVTVGSVVVAYVTMLMADQLNFASAIFAGYAANSTADLLTKEGRSTALKEGTIAGEIT